MRPSATDALDRDTTSLVFSFFLFFLVISCDASRIWETTLSSVDPHWGWGVVIPNVRLCLRHIANTAVSQRKCYYAVIELSHCDAVLKGLDVCVSYVVALDGTLRWAATCLGFWGGIHLIAHFKVKKLLASLGVPHPNSTETCYQPCTDPVPTLYRQICCGVCL